MAALCIAKLRNYILRKFTHSAVEKTEPSLVMSLTTCTVLLLRESVLCYCYGIVTARDLKTNTKFQHCTAVLKSADQMGSLTQERNKATSNHYTAQMLVTLFFTNLSSKGI